ncbi:MAG: TRAP transporter substrate-binding protein DctP [Myxococcota bacterium]
MRNVVVLALLGLLASGDVLNAEARADEVQSLRLATLAPRDSGLGQAFRYLGEELRKRTEGQVELKMYFGGVAGDELTVVRKMRAGQLDGALLTSHGLGALVRQVLVLQAPGLIGSYPELDEVRDALAPEFGELFRKAGYELITWGDSGRIRIFSQQKVQQPSDLKRVRPWVWRGSPTMRAFIEAAGANGVSLALPEVYGALQTGMIDTVIASSIGVLGFQWFTRLKTMSKQAGGIVVGAYVIRSDKLAALPQAARDYIVQSARDSASEFRQAGRKLDEEAYKALTKRLKGVNLWRYQQAWEAANLEARESLVGRLYSRALLTRVQEILGKP